LGYLFSVSELLFKKIIKKFQRISFEIRKNLKSFKFPASRFAAKHNLRIVFQKILKKLVQKLQNNII